MDSSNNHKHDVPSPIPNNMDSSKAQNESREQSMIRKVQICVPPSKYNQRTPSKVRISVSSSKYKQGTLTKVQTSVSSSKYKSSSLESCEHSIIKDQRHVNTTKQHILERLTQRRMEYTKPEKLCRNWTSYPPRHTPYGPYNLPHMVLYTKQGPVNV